MLSILNIRQSTLPGVLIALFMLSPAISAQEINHWESILSPGMYCRYLVPSSAVDASWTDSDFDDSGWAFAPGGVGYGVGDVLPNLTLEDCDGNSHDLNELCERDAGWIFVFAGW